MKEAIILGKGPSRTECLYDHETWALNDCFSFAKRIDKLFITDTWNEFDLRELHDARNKFGCDIIASTQCDGLLVTLYPIESVLRKFKTGFFTNTACYMIAYALLLGYEKLHLYGIDHLTHQSYVNEKGGVEYWMGVACGKGVEVINTTTSVTGKTVTGKLYGEWGTRISIINELTKGI